MSQVTRLSKINYRMFREFVWTAEIPDFGRFNLVYGWNASGKTTLSSLFRKIEKRQSLETGTADFAIDGRSCELSCISEATRTASVNPNYRLERLHDVVRTRQDAISAQRFVAWYDRFRHLRDQVEQRGNPWLVRGLRVAIVQL